MASADARFGRRLAGTGCAPTGAGRARPRTVSRIGPRKWRPDEGLLPRIRMERSAPRVRARLYPRGPWLPARLLRRSAGSRQSRRSGTEPGLRLRDHELPSQRPRRSRRHPGRARPHGAVRGVHVPRTVAKLSGGRVGGWSRRHVDRRAVPNPVHGRLRDLRSHRELPAGDQPPRRLPGALRLLLPGLLCRRRHVHAAAGRGRVAEPHDPESHCRTPEGAIRRGRSS